MHNIYCILNKINNKVYIGQTNDYYRRRSEHKCSSNDIVIDFAIKKYGKDNFEYWIVKIIDNKDQANQEEIYWIGEMRNQLGKENVYNISDGGGVNSGWIMSNEQKNKISVSKKGKSKSNSGSFNIGHTPHNKGIPTSEENKAKLRKPKSVKRVYTAEQCKAISDRMKGNKNGLKVKV